MAGALRLVLDDRPVGVPQAPARQLQAQTEIDVLAVHVIRLVEPAQGRERRPPQQQEGGIDPLWRLSRGHLDALAQQMSAQQPQRRRPQTLVVLPVTVDVDLGRVDRARARIAGQFRHQCRERIGAAAQVRVEHGKQGVATVDPAV